MRPSVTLRRLPKVAAAVTLATACVAGVASRDSGAPDSVRAADASLGSAAAPEGSPASAASSAAPVRAHTYVARADRSERISRSARRVTLVRKPEVTGHRFMTAPLNMWPAPREKGRPLAVLPARGRVALTGVRKAAFAQILHDGRIRWVKSAYLVVTKPKPKPKPEPKPKPTSTSSTGGGTSSSTSAATSSSTSASTGSAAGISTAPCPDGSGTESGLTSSAVRLFRSVCNAFPALSSYGGYDGHGEHSSGKAIDFMVTSSSLGQAVADWARAHASQLDLYDVIWAQHIWTPVRSGEGWRSMPDRGSSTANHYDHVHIAVN